MYVIRAVGETCRIMDSEDRVCFVGNLWECEAWLDREENLRPPRRLEKRASLPTRLGAAALPRWITFPARRLLRTQSN